MNINIQSEFDLIKHFFDNSSRPPRKDVVLAIGDDAAITQPNPNQRVVITTDTLVEGIHFFPNIDPADLAYKAVAVNISDLAAMGAEPAWMSLAITLPKIDTDWLERFSQSLFEILNHYNINLIGGDTTKGPLSLTLTAQGLLPLDKALCRHGAQKGDWVFVTGALGDSAAGLYLLKNQSQSLTDTQHYLIQRHLRPTPRVLMGQSLLSYASAAIDISDGLLADLSHILKRSQLGATLQLDKLPLSQALIDNFGLAQAEQFALSGGEDYELCFTVSDENYKRMQRFLSHIGTPYTCIGQIRESKTHSIHLERAGRVVHQQPIQQGYDHFKS